MDTGTDRSAPSGSLRSVALPVEHGGWSLTLEPVVLGLLVAPSWPGVALGLAALVAFTARTPLKLVLVDRWRGRWLPRTSLAARALGAQLTLVAALVALAGAVAGFDFLLPVGVALPLILIELWYDMRSRSRRLLPELTGAVGIGAAAAAIAIAGEAGLELAFGLWAVIAARSTAAIPYVRHQISRTKTHPSPVWYSDVAQMVAVLGAAAGSVAALIPPASVAALAVVGAADLVAVRLPPRRAAAIGVEQVVSGLLVVLVTAFAV